MTAKNYKRDIYNGTMWSLIDNFSKQAITFVVFVVLARLLEPAIFGLLSVALLVVQVFRSVVFDSIATAIVRKAKPDDDDYNTGFWMCLGLSLPAFLILYFLADYVELWIGTKGLAKVMQGTSLMILTSGLGRMHEAFLTNSLNFKSLAIRSSISVSAGGVVGIILAIYGWGVESLVVQQLVTSFLEVILLWAVTPWKPKVSFSRNAYTEIVSYSKHVALTGITNFANQNSDVFFVTYFLGSAKAGIYSTGKRITNTFNFVISSALLKVSLPAFSRLQDNEKELQSAYLHSTSLTAMVTAPLFIGLAILSKDITVLMLGAKWSESAVVMQIVTVIGFLTSIGYYNQSIMLVKNKPEWQTRLTLVYAVTNILAFVVFTRYGLLYTALAFSGRALLLYPASVWCATTLINISWRRYISAILPSILSAALMALTMFGISNFLGGLSTIFRLTALIGTGAVSYAVFIWFSMPVSYKEIVVKSVGEKLIMFRR